MSYKSCYECGSTDRLTLMGDKLICEKCMIWYDYDEEFEHNGEDEHIEAVRGFEIPDD